MVVVYWDTSAWFKKYLNYEKGYVRAVGFLSENHISVTSVLTELEALATLEKLKSSKLLDSPYYRNLSSQIEKDFENAFSEKVVVTERILSKAKKMVRL